MVNLLIARNTYSPKEGVGMFIIKNKCIYLNDRFRLALVEILKPEKYLKEGMQMEKSKGMEKRGGRNKQKKNH